MRISLRLRSDQAGPDWWSVSRRRTASRNGAHEIDQRRIEQFRFVEVDAVASAGCPGATSQYPLMSGSRRSDRSQRLQQRLFTGMPGSDGLSGPRATRAVVVRSLGSGGIPVCQK